MRNAGTIAVVVLLTGPAMAAEAPKEKTAVAGAGYKAGPVHRLLLGADYRDLWTRPVRLEVLDLDGYAGGLKPVRRVGGAETKGLAMKGADGRDYTFRGIDKDPSELLPADLRDSVAREILQDQIASAHPAAPLVVPTLMEAAGVPHTTPRLVVMPDDPRLGEFRGVFAGLVGTIEEYPRPVSADNPGFAGASEIINSADMWTKLQASSADRIDARALLRARLMDVFIGDFDRHRSQWRWAKIPGQTLWQPIPEDRDQAFVRFQGILLDMGRRSQPRFVEFGPQYPTTEGLTFNGWDVDRKLLVELSAKAWDEIAADLRARLTDAVIDQAVARLPAEYAAVDARRLARDLEVRRDHLPEEARRYYRHLAGQVDVRTTDRPETVEARATPDGGLDLTVAESGAASPYFHRVFLPQETSEVRLYLAAGEDVVTVTGSSRIRLRVLGGAGCDTVKGDVRGVYVSDDDGCTKAAGAHLDARTYQAPKPNPRAPWIPPRDWGRHTKPTIWLGGNTDIGLFLGTGRITQGYGFRKDPFADHQRLRAGYATGRKSFKAEYEGDFRFENSHRKATLYARASGIDVLRFYGFGNDTKPIGSDDFHEVHQNQFLLMPSLTLPAGGFELSFGPIVKYSTTETPANRFIGQVRPYGVENFGQAGGRMALVFDRRDRIAAPSRGVFAAIEGRVFPPLWTVRSTFGETHGEASTYLSAKGGLQPTLAFRVGGKRVWGDYPFQEAAFIGGSDSVRGFRPQRFAGDGALWGNAELRLRLTHIYIAVPGEMGVFGLVDSGRVFLSPRVVSVGAGPNVAPGDSSATWHSAAGGGLWFSFVNRDNTLTLGVAQSKERTAVYVHGGFSF